MEDIEFYKLQALMDVLDENLLFDITPDKGFLISIVKQFKKLDICGLADYDKYYQDEYERFTALRYHLNHVNSIIEDLNKLKDNINNDNKELLNTILIKMTDINDIIDMIPEE